MNILGISSFYYDSASCLLRSGELIAAAQEERFTRKKHDGDFPANAIQYCLKEAGIEICDIDLVGFYDKTPSNALKIRSFLKKIGYRKEIITFSLQESYLAGAFYPSPFEKAAILTNASAPVGIVSGRGKGRHIDFFQYLRFPYSLGSLYSAVTHYLGFDVKSEEYKVMGLSAYGKAKYRDLLLKNKETLSSMDLQKTTKMLKEISGVAPRQRERDILQAHMDIAASLQAVIEEETLNITSYISQISGCDALCLSGEIALNCLLNSKILQQGLFKKAWAQPASTAAGCAIGAAFLVWHKHLGNPRNTTEEDRMKHGFLGPSYSDAQIEVFLTQNGIRYQKIDYSHIPEFTADLLAQGNVVGWFQGRLEFGPRALGNRSILADSRNLSMHERLNLKVKFREPFRPLAPSVLQDAANQYFELPQESPYMLFTATVKEDKRSLIPAVTHVDNSSRVQTIKRDTHPLYYDTIYAFLQKTGCPVIVNTSFNTKNEPIVLSPQDAYNCFKNTDMDYLIMGSYILDKSNI